MMIYFRGFSKKAKASTSHFTVWISDTINT